MKPKKGTYLVEFCDGSKYVFGNNYKEWWYHAIELAMERWRHVSKHQIVKSVHYSHTPFVDDGGLKYCDAGHYQEIIDDVSKNTGEKLLPFDQYVFVKDNRELAKIDRKLERW